MSILFLFSLACSSSDKSVSNTEFYSPEEDSADEQNFAGSVWSAGLENIPASSSSRLDLRWNTAEDENIALFQLEITDQRTNTIEQFQFDPNQSQAVIENRKAQTTYTVNIEACLDDACSLRLSVLENNIEAETESQRWIVQGTSFETMEILVENVADFSVGSFDYQTSELDDQLWIYSSGSLESYSHTEDGYSAPTSSCWDESCFSAVQQFQLNASSLWVLDSDNTIYQQDSEDIESCSQDCSSEVLFSSENDSLNDFFFVAARDVIFWEGISSCQEEAIFLASSSDEIWRNRLNAEGCPKAIAYSAKSPRLVSVAEHNLLYFQNMGQIYYLYAEDAGLIQWEAEDDARSLILEWDDGSEISVDDFRIGSMAFNSSDRLYFSFQAPEVSSEQYSMLSLATLQNP